MTQIDDESKTMKIIVAVEPGPLGIYVDEIPGDEYPLVSGFQGQSPLNAVVKVGDRIQGINGMDIKGWTLEKLASYCNEHKDSERKIEFLQSSTSSFSFTGKKGKSIPHKRSSPPKTSKLRSKIGAPTPPPMAAFEKLRPRPPAGYQRKIVNIPPGRIGIRVRMKNDMLAIFEVIEDSPIKHLVQVDDIIEGVDNLYEETWDMPRFLAHIKATNDAKRTFHMFVKVKPPANPYRLPVPTPKKPATRRQSAISVLKQITSPGGTAKKVLEPIQPDNRGLYRKPETLPTPDDSEWDERQGVWVPSAL